MLIGIVLGAVLAGVGAAYWLVRRRRTTSATRSAKVVPIRAARQRRTDKSREAGSKAREEPGKPREAAAGEQARPCSLCRERSARLSFYVDEGGRTIGVCKNCRSKAEARELDRL
ncbi:hypothetical protein SAMN05216312_101218 [Cohnella sp. OV330]|uniref:hypothetical protein n=1 Tax=Cohnella sp. OV330 TaxID=1855288 RepID=UPI0008E45DD2|nr:hypothetical protein [Cohnella sp. OV330]SFA73913.1 hypothetical protein SAMN05216312_101218 [Cohnella sp. OV330]